MTHPAALPPPWLVWLYPGRLSRQLDATSKLEITRELRKAGWRVDLITGEPQPLTVIRGVEVMGFPSPEIYLIRHLVYHLKVIRYLLAHWQEVRVVMFHQLSIPWILPLRLLRSFHKGGAPLFLLDTRTLPMQGRAKLKDHLRGNASNLMNAIGNHFADGQTAITPRMAASLHIPPEKLWGVWPSGVNLEVFAPAQDRRHWPLEGEPVKLVYAGVFSEERNLLSLCQAVEQANQEGMRFEVSLVGNGPQRDALAAFCTQADGYIRMLAPVPNEQVPAILSQMHVGALPFPDKENFRVSSPIKLFEYIGAGLVILATRIPCHTDVIQDDRFVFWAEDASVAGLLAALRNLWQRRASLPEMGKQAGEAATYWTWEASAKRLNGALWHGIGLNQKIGARYSMEKTH